MKKQLMWILSSAPGNKPHVNSADSDASECLLSGVACQSPVVDQSKECRALTTVTLHIPDGSVLPVAAPNEDGSGGLSSGRCLENSAVMRNGAMAAM